MPKIEKYILTFIAASFFVIPIVSRTSYTQHALIMSLLNGIVASSLWLIGLSGQLSLAHGCIMAIGAYVSALTMLKLQLSAWMALGLSALSVSCFAFIIAIPLMRLKGVYFSVASLFLTAIAVTVAQQWRELTGGPLGLYNIPSFEAIRVGGIVLDLGNPLYFYYLVLFLFVFAIFTLGVLGNSWFGFILRAVRQSDSLAQSLGINVTLYKIVAFTVGSFYQGIVGSLYAMYMSTITPDAFGFLTTLYGIIYLIVGGQASILGPVLGAIILTWLPEWLRPLKQMQPLVFAALLIVIVYSQPKGLIGISQRLLALRFRKRTPCLR